MVGWGGAFFLFIGASPVVVVTDQYEVTLYGKERIQKACLRSALGVWKPLRLVYGERGEDPERLVLKIGLVARRPALVVFPSWFFEGALQYTKVYADIPVGLWFSQGDLPLEKEAALSAFPGYIGRIDYRKDMEKLVSLFLWENPKNVSRLKIDKESWGEALGAQVQASLERAIQNHLTNKGIPFGNRSSEIPGSDQNDESLWIMGPGSVKTLDGKGSYVVYSWQDPLSVPSSVVVLLDDSRWPQLVSFARDIWRGERQRGERQIWYTSIQRLLKK